MNSKIAKKMWISISILGGVALYPWVLVVMPLIVAFADYLPLGNSESLLVRVLAFFGWQVVGYFVVFFLFMVVTKFVQIICRKKGVAI